jgi:hypothetical protein
MDSPKEGRTMTANAVIPNAASREKKINMGEKRFLPDPITISNPGKSLERSNRKGGENENKNQ